MNFQDYGPKNSLIYFSNGNDYCSNICKNNYRVAYTKTDTDSRACDNFTNVSLHPNWTREKDICSKRLIIRFITSIVIQITNRT